MSVETWSQRARSGITVTRHVVARSSISSVATWTGVQRPRPRRGPWSGSAGHERRERPLRTLGNLSCAGVQVTGRGSLTPSARATSSFAEVFLVPARLWHEGLSSSRRNRRSPKRVANVSQTCRSTLSTEKRTVAPISIPAGQSHCRPSRLSESNRRPHHRD